MTKPDGSPALSAALAVGAVLLLVFWCTGPSGMALPIWFPAPAEQVANLKGGDVALPNPSLHFWAKTLLGFADAEAMGVRLHDRTSIREWVGPLEGVFTFMLLANATLAVGLATALLWFRRQNGFARELALALSCIAFAVALFLVVGQDGLRQRVLGWPSSAQLVAESAITFTFILGVVRFDRLLSTFPVRLEDWQVVRSLLAALGSASAEARARRWYRPDRANLLRVVRRLPWLILVLQVVGNVLFTVPFLLWEIDWGPRADGVESPWANRLAFGGAGIGLLCWVGSLLALMAFAWAFAVTLLARLRAAREHCTAQERRESDWLFASGALVALLLIMVSAGLVMGMFYLAWGDSEWVRAVAFPGVAFLFPLGGLAVLAALAGAVFLSRSFGPQPLMRVTFLVAAVGLTMSFLVSLLQHTLVDRLLAGASDGLQRGTSTLLSAGVAMFAFGFFRQAIDRRLTGWLDRFLPATIIAEGERCERTVVFSDLAGYTALAARDEPRALHAAGLLQKAAAEIARRTGGRVIKTIGDAVLWTFPRPDGALQATRALAEELASALGREGLPAMAVNSGVHHGSVVVAPNGDVYGAAVNLAARLQGVAKDGAVVATSEVLLEAPRDFVFEPLGRLELKNVPTPIACFRVRPAARPAAGGSAAEA